MATTLTFPQAIGQPFATGGDKATLPETAGAAGVASLNKGIPAECSLPIGSGGAYARRTDINGLGYLTTSFQYFMQNGGVMAFNADVSTAIGGYPTGARLWASLNGITTIVRSTADNNTTNPISGSSPNQTLAAGWVMDLPNTTYVDDYDLHSASSVVVDQDLGANSVWYTVDLSSVVGQFVTMVHLKTEGRGGSYGGVMWRTKGSSEAFVTYTNATGVRGGTVGTPAGTVNHAQVITDALGRVEVCALFSASTANMKVTIEAFQRLHV